MHIFAISQSQDVPTGLISSHWPDRAKLSAHLAQLGTVKYVIVQLVRFSGISDSFGFVVGILAHYVTPKHEPSLIQTRRAVKEYQKGTIS